MDEPNLALEAYDENLIDIPDDDVSDDAADVLESRIQQELAKFHQQQAAKYAEISASGQWAALALPSPDPFQQQTRADERQQQELLHQEPKWQQEELATYIPSPNALAVQQLWQQQVQQQDYQPQQQQLQLSPFRSQRPWSTAAHAASDAAAYAHQTYSADATDVEAQQQERATGCNQHLGLGQEQSGSTPRCNTTGGDAPAADVDVSDTQAPEQEAAEVCKLDASTAEQGQPEQLNGRSSTGVAYTTAENAAPDTVLSAFNDSGEQPDNGQEVQQLQSWDIGAGQHENLATILLADETVSNAEAPLCNLGAAQQHNRQQKVRQPQEWGVACAEDQNKYRQQDDSLLQQCQQQGWGLANVESNQQGWHLAEQQQQKGEDGEAGPQVYTEDQEHQAVDQLQHTQGEEQPEQMQHGELLSQQHEEASAVPPVQQAQRQQAGLEQASQPVQQAASGNRTQVISSTGGVQGPANHAATATMEAVTCLKAVGVAADLHCSSSDSPWVVLPLAAVPTVVRSRSSNADQVNAGLIAVVAAPVPVPLQSDTIEAGDPAGAGIAEAAAPSKSAVAKEAHGSTACMLQSDDHTSLGDSSTQDSISEPAAAEAAQEQQCSVDCGDASGGQECAADELGIYQDPDDSDDNSSCSTPAAGVTAPEPAACGSDSSANGYEAANAHSPSPAPACSPSRGTSLAVAGFSSVDACWSVHQATVGVHSLSVNKRSNGIGCSGGTSGPAVGLTAHQPHEYLMGAAQWGGRDAGISAWPAECCHPAMVAHRDSTTCSPNPPDQQQQQQCRRPVHSRSRPAGTQSPLLQGVGNARMGFAPAGGPGAGGLGGRIRPGSAPCQHFCSPAKPSCIDSTLSINDSVQQSWMPGRAAATQQQLQQACQAYRTGSTGKGSSRAGTAVGVAYRMATRPHTSGALSSRSERASPANHRPPGQVLAAGEGVSVDTTVRGKGGLRNKEASCTHQQSGLLQQRQQQCCRPMARSCSAPKARLCEPSMQQSSVVHRPSSSRVYSSSSANYNKLNCQQQQQPQQRKEMPLHEETETAVVQYWANGRCVSGLQADRANGGQQLQSHRLQPDWDASPIPLSMPKTVPMAQATQPAEVLVAAQVQRGELQPATAPHVAGSRAAIVRPATAGAAGAAAILREHPDSLGAVVHGGCSTSSSSSYSRVYLVEIQQKLKQANSCCRKLGIGRHYCMAPSTKARWNVEQITVQVWQFAADAAVITITQQHSDEQHSQPQQGGWQLKAQLTLYQFNKQLDKLLAKSAAHAAAADSTAAAGNMRFCYADEQRGTIFNTCSNGSSMSSSPAGSRGVSPDRSRPASMMTQADKLGVLVTPSGVAVADSGGRQCSMLSPRRQAAMLLQLQQQRHKQAEEIAAPAAAEAVRLDTARGPAMLPYGIPAWLQEHL